MGVLDLAFAHGDHRRHRRDRRALRKALQRLLQRRGLFIAVLRLERDGLFHNVSQLTPGRARIGEGAALHAVLQGIGACFRRVLRVRLKEGHNAVVQGGIEYQTDGINVGRWGELPIPELLRGDELQGVGLQSGDGAAARRTQYHLAVHRGDVARPDSAVAAVRADGVLHRLAKPDPKPDRLAGRHGIKAPGKGVVGVK